MNEPFAVDANAVVDLLRADRPNPPQLGDASDVFLPLPVAGELFAGAFASKRSDGNLADLEQLIARWTVLEPNIDTARVYGRLRGDSRFPMSTSRRNDLWIAALCVQHNLPLLTNDSGFDSIPGLRTLHW